MMESVSFFLSQICPGKVVVAGGPSVPVLLQGLLVLCEGRLPQLKFVRSLLHFRHILLKRCFICLVSLKGSLEVEPVLNRVVEGLL